MNSHRVLAFFLISLGGIFSPPASAAQSQPKASESDEAAIKQVFTDFYESFSRHDSHAVAMTFAEDGDFTNMNGARRHGRSDIEARFATLFAGTLKDSRRTDIVRSIRFFAPDVASVDADTVISGTKAADGSDVPPRKGLMIVTMIKQNGRWLIATFHEAEFPEPRGGPAVRPTPNPANK